MASKKRTSIGMKKTKKRPTESMISVTITAPLQQIRDNFNDPGMSPGLYAIMKLLGDELIRRKYEPPEMNLWDREDVKPRKARKKGAS